MLGIKTMKVPKCCSKCNFKYYDEGENVLCCALEDGYISDDEADEKRLECCPLVEIEERKVDCEHTDCKNCESCEYYGLNYEVCNYCYKCSLWTEKEPTTKNDLSVIAKSNSELIARGDVINTIQELAEYHTGDSFNADRLIRNIKGLPSVTPQEPQTPMVEIDLYSVIKQRYIEREVLDKIKAEISELRSKQNVGVLECLDIIDKYRAESEETDESI